WRPGAGGSLRARGGRAGRPRAESRRGLRRHNTTARRAGADRCPRLQGRRPAQPDARRTRASAGPGGERHQALLERDGQAHAGARGRASGRVRRAGAGIAVRARGRPLAVRLDVVAGGDDLRRLVRDPAQHHRRARARPPQGTLTLAATDVVDRIKAHIGKTQEPVTATVEAGHLKRFAEAIRDPNPRWREEAPPTFLAAIAPTSYHLDEAEH